MFRWSVLTILLSMVPVVTVALRITGGGWEEATYRGELILISIVVAGTGVGTAASVLRALGKRMDWVRDVVVFGGILFCVMAAALYEDTYSSTTPATAVKQATTTLKAPAGAASQRSSPSVAKPFPLWHKVRERSYVLGGLGALVGLGGVIVANTPPQFALVDDDPDESSE